MRDFVLVFVNGVRHEVRGATVFSMAAEWLRKELGLVGTKIVCAEGDCGACTILRAYPTAQKNGAPEFLAINSCIATVGHLDACSIVTVEGLGGETAAPVQVAMQECHGSQCGYCTPGFVMAMAGMFERYDKVDARTAANYLTGNLCRCTGYSPILEAATQVQQLPEFRASSRYMNPQMLGELQGAQADGVRIELPDGRIYFSPTRIETAAKFMTQNSGARILGAATDVGVQVNKGKPLNSQILSLRQITKLDSIKLTKGRMVVGANVSLTELRRSCEKKVPEFANFLDLFASPQIKNVATLIGNVANGSPIGDTLPFLMVSDAHIHLKSASGDDGGDRVVLFTEYFKGYKQFNLRPGEIITHISFVIPNKNEIILLEKASQRKDLDISAVSAAIWMELSSDKLSITALRFALGGVAATPVRIRAVEDSMVGKVLNDETVESAKSALLASIQPLSDVRGSAEYRKILATNIFVRLMHRAREPKKKSVRRTQVHSTLPTGGVDAR